MRARIIAHNFTAFCFVAILATCIGGEGQALIVSSMVGTEVFVLGVGKRGRSGLREVGSAVLQLRKNSRRDGISVEGDEGEGVRQDGDVDSDREVEAGAEGRPMTEYESM